MALLAFVGIAFLNVVLAMGSGQKRTVKPPDAKQKVEAQANSSAETGASIDTTPHSSNWSYRTSTDDMTGVMSKVACMKSTNELSFNFPYGGGSTGELCFRRSGKSLNSWIEISSGQFLCGIEECSLKLKFDDGAIQTFRAVESTTHESNLLFIRSEQKLLSLAEKAQKLKLQAQYYQEGSQTLYFDLSGLDNKQL